MLNAIWLILILGSVIIAVFTGNLKAVTVSATESAEAAFKLAIGFTGVMALWLGIMRVAQDSGLIAALTRLITPAMRYLFPGVPKDNPAIAGMAMNMVANMFGLNNAATPLGIKAMHQLDELNPNKGTATHAMCMFLAINTSSLQLIPAGAIALLSAGGSSDPTAIVFPAILATTVSTVVGIASARFLSKLTVFSDPNERRKP